jgi:acetate---CoA ligase (ADP-forming)
VERGSKEGEAEEEQVMEDFSRLSNFFYPDSIAVIGVSGERNNLARNIVQNCLTFGYPGEILSVGLRNGVVFGQRVYSSLDEIDREIHLAVILTPAKTIPGILEQCGRKGIKWVVIESAGFSEMGEAGKPLEEACTRIAQKYQIRFIGPNGIGVTNLENGLALPFMPLREDLSLGPVSILAQSGGVALSYLSFLVEENIGINKLVSMGNKLNVDENDLLGYLIQDEGTKIILVYLEGFTDGRRFMEIASSSKKPILVHKSNRFKTSSQIAHSHTAALFADDALVDQALEQVGCVRVNTMSDAMDYIKSLTLPPLKGNRLAVVSRSGGHAVIATDACAHYGFELPPFPESVLREIENRLRAHVIHLQNPLDLGDLFELEFYEYIVEEVLKRDDVDGVLLGHGYRRGFEQEPSRMLISKVEDLVYRYQKPVAVVVFAEAVEIDYLKKTAKIPVFTAPENAMRAFYLSYKWATRKPSSMVAQTIQDVDLPRADHILHNASSTTHLLLAEALDLLRCYGFSLPAFTIARSAEEALAAREAVNAPVAMKINRPHLSHKSDAGALRLRLNSPDQITRAFRDLQEKGGPDTEVLVQAMVDEGREVILGGKRDAVFGPVILFGLGGIFVEAIQDVVWRVAPVNTETARGMIRSIRGAKILSGLRGEEPYDVDAIAACLERLSHMLVDFPMIQEIDINPVKVFQSGQGAQALDARVIIK